jgi:tetratricopeptide (TPR) repeat protein
MVCVSQGDYARARTAYEQALRLSRSAGNRDLESRYLMNLGGAALALGDYDESRELLTESRGITRELGNELMLARIANLLGVLELMQDRLEEAEPWFEESLAAFERSRDREGAGVALLNLGLIGLRAGRLEDAASRLREGLRLAEELQHALQLANCVQGLAAVAAQLGNFARAGQLLGIAHAFLDASGAAHEPFLSALRDETAAAVRAGLGEGGAAEAFESGRSQSRSDALVYAGELHVPAHP